MDMKKALKDYMLIRKRTKESMDKLGNLCKYDTRPDDSRYQKIRESQDDLRLRLSELNALHELMIKICYLKNEKHRNVMWYICSMKWRDMEEVSHYTSRHLYRIHKEAMEEMEG